MIRILLIALALFSAAAIAQPTLAQQTYDISLTLRDPASANLSLAESETQIAYELKGRIAELLAEGKSQAEIETILVARYGEQIRYQPAFSGATAALWLLPILLLTVLLSALLWRQYRSARN